MTFSGNNWSTLRTGFWDGRGILGIWYSHPPTLIVARHSFHNLSFVTLTSCSTSGLEQNPGHPFCLLTARVHLATTRSPHLCQTSTFLAWILQKQKQKLKRVHSCGPLEAALFDCPSRLITRNSQRPEFSQPLPCMPCRISCIRMKYSRPSPIKPSALSAVRSSHFPVQTLPAHHFSAVGPLPPSRASASRLPTRPTSTAPSLGDSTDPSASV